MDLKTNTIALVAGSLVVVGALRAALTNLSGEDSLFHAQPSVRREREVTAESLAVLDDAAVETDLFRLSNRPPLVRYTPGSSGGPAGPVGPSHIIPSRPTLVLRGILGGPPWQAIIDGLPGAPPATVVRIGDRVGGLVVRDIRLDVVTVAATDTTWRLSLRGSHQ